MPQAKRQRSDEAQSNGSAKPADSLTSADYYADSYAHFGIHEEMLKDTVRTETYRQAILKNKHLFKGKTVLDVGCGTGILSMFAAQAGAARVIGVDMSGILDFTQQIIKDNHFEDKITLIKGKVEEIELPVESVDIIISEWMGYFLLYESMLDTVLVARDKWLCEGGLLFPDKATLYLCGIEDAEYKAEKIDFWENVYGLNMRAIQQTAMEEPLVDVVDAQAIVTDATPILTLNLATCTVQDLDFRAEFQICAERDDFVHAFVAYFDVGFPGHTPIGFSTSPVTEATHWKQTVFYLNQDLAMKKGDSVQGSMFVRKGAHNPRDLEISLTFEMDGQVWSGEDSQEYKLR